MTSVRAETTPFGAAIARGVALGMLIGWPAGLAAGLIVFTYVGVVGATLGAGVGALSAFFAVVSVRAAPRFPRRAAAIGACFGSLAAVPLLAWMRLADIALVALVIVTPLCALIAARQVGRIAWTRSATSAAGWWTLVAGNVLSLAAVSVLVRTYDENADWDPGDTCMRVGNESDEFQHRLLPPQATCFTSSGPVELVADSTVLGIGAVAAAAAVIFLVALLLLRPWRGVRTIGTNRLPIGLGAWQLCVAAVIAVSCAAGLMGPEPLPRAGAAPAHEPRKPTSEELDGWSFVIPAPGTTSAGSYDDSLASTLTLADSTLLAVGRIPHPWDPEREPSFPTRPLPCGDQTERPFFEARFEAEDNSGAVERVRTLWVELGFTIDPRSTASHVVAVAARPSTGSVLSIQHYDRVLRVQISGECGSAVA